MVELPPVFYERLAAAQKEFGTSRAKLLMRGLDLAIKEEPAKRVPVKTPKVDEST